MNLKRTGISKNRQWTAASHGAKLPRNYKSCVRNKSTERQVPFPSCTFHSPSNPAAGGDSVCIRSSAPCSPALSPSRAFPRNCRAKQEKPRSKLLRGMEGTQIINNTPSDKSDRSGAPTGRKSHSLPAQQQGGNAVDNRGAGVLDCCRLYDMELRIGLSVSHQSHISPSSVRTPCLSSLPQS